MKLSENGTVVRFVRELSDMLDKKLAGERLNLSEKTALKRIESCLLIRALVDPTVDFKFPESYVPPQIEIDISFSLLSGSFRKQDISSEEMLVRIKSGLEEFDMNDMDIENSILVAYL